MYNQPTEYKSISVNNNIPHKFFERKVDNNLVNLKTFLLEQYNRIEKG